jgi:nitrite reductase/ring-hydroxylating ferredoxin subunit
MVACERVIGESAALVDGGPGARFAIPGQVGAEIAAFAIRFRGTVQTYVNRCTHHDIELDWVTGAFFDGQGEYLVRAMRGARYAPDSGRCIDGPCRGARLTRVPVHGRAGDGAIVLGPAPAAASMVIDTDGKPHHEQDRHG